MRYVCPATVAVILASSVMFGESTTQNLSITNYQFVNEQRVTLTQSKVTYRADLVNPGSALGAVTATLSSAVSSVQAVSGSSSLHFTSVPANSQVTSSDTFTILVDRTVTFSFSNLAWTFQSDSPVANAGANQTAKIGSTVTLNGSGSTNPSGTGTLTYSWVFTTLPTGSAATLSNPTSVMPTFVADVAGNYVITLMVSNGIANSSASVTVSTTGTPPVANAGPNQTVSVGSTTVLNGSGSTSVDGRSLTYAWTLITRPLGSAAVLTGANTVSPTFVADKAGTYVAQLIVNDGLTSSPSTVTITTNITHPVANAGSNQVVNVNSIVQLNGAGSTDANGLPLTYRWSLITLPAGSAAGLSDPTAVNPNFIDDVPGTYVAQLIVNNGTFDSTPATTTITTNPVLAPVANAGTNQTASQNQTVHLSGTGTDPQSLPLTYQWALISKPTGSSAALSSAVIANPAFTADLIGTYVAQLIVNNGYLSSAPSTVTITIGCAQPTANPGSSQNVPTGATVTLNGSGSGDACQDPMTYAWSFTTRPAGSAATLSGATTVSPTFVADVAGTYVVQLIVNNGVTNSNPATVTISAQALTLTPNPLNLTNASGTLTLTLSVPAGANGQIVNLASGNTNVATVPATVTIPQGGTSATVTVTPGNTTGSTSITATVPGLASGTATVNVTVATLTVALDSGTLGLSRTINGTVTLSAPAPAGGVIITLSSTPAGIVDVESPQVTIAAGNSTGSFTVTGSTVGTATISASGPGYGSGSANVNVVIFGTIGLSSNVAVGLGQSIAFPVTLSASAPAGGVTVTLTSSDTSRVTVTPSSVFIAAGAKTPDTQPQVNGINIGSATINASAASYNAATQSVKVTATVSFSPKTLTITGAVTQNLTLTLSSPAPIGGLTVNVTSDNASVATVPQTVTFTSNATTVNVPVTGVAQGSTAIHASALPNIADTSASVTVVSDITLPATVTVAPGQSTSFSVTLVNPAPANGAFITLSSSDTSKATVTPANIFVPQGATVPSAPPKVNGIAFGSATITASSTSYVMQASMQAQVTATLSFYPTSIIMAQGTALQGLALVLSAPAPTGGLTFNVSSDNTTVATAPQTITIPAGQTSATVVVTAGAVGTTLIHASALPYVADTSASVTVVGPGAITLPTVTVGLGQAVAFPVTLGTAAPDGGVTVTLSTSDSGKVTVSPTSVTIPAGQTQPTTQPQITSTGIGSATITALATGYNTGTGTVTVTAPVMAFSGPVTINAETPGTLTLNLTGGQAPAAGLAVSLSSDNTSVFTVGAQTVTFAPGQTSVSVPITGGPVTTQQTAHITASATGIANATTTVTVNPVGGIQVSSVTVGTNQSTTLSVTLPAAPASTVTVALTNGDSTKVTVSPASITIAAGSTTGTAQVTGVSAGTANIVATASDYTTGSGTVTVTPLVMSFVPTPPATLTIGSGAQGALTLNLTGGQAPAGGLTVNLSSDNANAATMSSTATFMGGATATTITVTGLVVQSSQTANITASATGIANATAIVTVTPLPTIGVPATTSIGLGLSTPFAVALLQAPATDLTVKLSTSDSALVTVSPTTVTIPAGQLQPTTQPQVTGAGIGSATITVLATGYANGTGTVTVTPPTPAFTPATLTVNPGAKGTLTLNLTGGQAPAGGLTMNLTSSALPVATVPDTVSFSANATSATVSVTGVAAGTTTITANAPGFTTSATSTVTVPGQIVVGSVSVGLGLTTSVQVTLPQAAPTGGVTVNFTSNAATTVAAPASITIASGATIGTATVTGLGIGPATITAVATGYISGTGTVTVTAPTMTFSPATLSVNAGGKGTLTLNLTGGQAPVGGLTVNLGSSDTNKATVPTSVSLAAGATSTTVAVTGVAAGGPVTITASATGITNTTAQVTVTASTITLTPVSVGLGMTGNLVVTLSQAAPSGGTTISFTSNAATTVAAPASITIASGATTGTATVTGLSIGPATITASATTGYTSGSGTVTVTAPTMAFSGSPLTVNTGGTGALTLNLTGGKAPTGGLIVNLISSSTAIATVPGTVTLTAGTTSTTVTVTGVAAGGPVTISASAANIVTTTASVTVQAATLPSSTITLPSVSVGQNLQTSISLSISPAAPSGGLAVKVTSLDSNKLLVAGRQTDAGSQQVTFTVAEGATVISGIYLQGLVSTGTVTLQASAPQYNSGTATITLTPSGFTLAGPGGASSFTTNVGAASSSLTVSAARLDASLNFAEVQQVHTGVSVNLTSSPSNVGTVSSAVTFASGDSTATALFTPATSNANTGSATLTVSTPTGYSTPVSGTSVTAVVNSSTLLPSSVTVGNLMETTANVSLAGAAPSGGLQVTVTSGNSGLLQFSTTATGAGSGSIVVTVPSGRTTTPDFYVYGLGSSGSVSYTATASGFVMGTGTVTLAPSGFVLASASGIGHAFTAFNASTPIYVYPVQLDSAGKVVASQALAGSASPVNITVNNDNSLAGSINPAQVTVAPGSSVATTSFIKANPATAQTANLTIVAPTGFNTPASVNTTVQGTVYGVGSLKLSCDGTTIGQNLQSACTATVGTAPSSALSVTLTADGSGQLLLAASGTDSGSNSITVTIPANSTSVTYYAQSLSSSGTVTHTATAAGYGTVTATITLAPAGIVIAGPYGLGASFFLAPVSTGPVSFTVYTAILNADNSFNSLQPLRGGIASLPVTLNSSDTGKGTITSPTIQGGNSSATATFTPKSAGSVTVTVVTPSGFTTPINDISVLGSVL